MTIFNMGPQAEASGRASLEFMAGGSLYEGEDPRPRGASVALARETWPAGHVEVVRFGPFLLDGRAPRELRVRGGVAGSPLQPLGALVRGNSAGDPVAFRRHFPLADQPDGYLRLVVAAVVQRLDPRRFVLRVAYLNCGERFDRDLSAFVHFELGAKGEDVAESCELKLFPRSGRMDTSTWRPDELTVVRFDPFEIPANAPDIVYIRAGIYDQFGTKERTPIAGSDDGTGRVLVGRFVRKRGVAIFERIWPSTGKGTVP